MGWIGWDWDRVRHTDVNVLNLALEGRTDLLKAIFGDPTTDRKSQPMSAQRFRTFANQHNRRYHAKGQRRGSRGG